jgi:N-methylhydantoinase A
LPQVHVTASHELLPELREYERGATCAANAVVAPKMGAYVSRLATHLPSLRIMGSDGGTLPVETVLRAPVHTVLSGPAGGVVGALVSAREALDEPAPRLMSFDMGGTSTDVALCEGEPSASPWWTSTPSARAAARSPGWTLAARCASAHNPAAPRLGPRATASNAPPIGPA